MIRGVSALLWLRELGARRGASLALFGATGLPLIVAVVGIGAESGAVAPDVGASLIGAGMISVLLFPLAGTALAGPGGPVEADEAAAAADAVTEY